MAVGAGASAAGPTWIPAFGLTQGEALYLSLDLCSAELLWRYGQKTNAGATTQ